MPYSIELPLTDIPRGDVSAHLLRNNIYRWFELTDRALADQLHAIPDKPFKVSTLKRDRDGAAFRVTLLDDGLYAPLSHGLTCEAERAAQAGFPAQPFLRLHDRTYGVCVDHIHVLGDTYAALAQQTDIGTQVFLEFLTPTAFEVDQRALLLPNPRNIFESYFNRWNQFAPAEICIPADWLTWAASTIVVSRLRIESHSMTFEDHVQLGFVGRVGFELKPSPKAEPLPVKEFQCNAQIFNMLAHFAFFCGTGRKTTQGMGQTTRLINWDNISPKTAAVPIRAEHGELAMPLWFSAPLTDKV